MRDVASGKTAKRIKTRKHGVARVTGGRGAATRTVGLLGAIFSYAQKRSLRSDNPVHGVTKFAGKSCKRSMPPAEYKKLGDGLEKATKEGVNLTGLAIIKFLAVTGWRLGEARKLRWDAIDKEHCTAHLADTKSDNSRRPLSQPAIKIIEAQLQANEWVFPASVGDGHYGSVDKVFKKVRELGELPSDITPKTFRSAYASSGNDLGYTEATLGEIIGHKGEKSVTREHYIKPADKVVVAAADEIAKKIEEYIFGAINSDSNADDVQKKSATKQATLKGKKPKKTKTTKRIR